MKKFFVFTLLSLMLTGCGQVPPDEMDVVSSYATSFRNGTIQHITVVVNDPEISDYEDCAKKIIEKCLTNDFKSVLFCWGPNDYPIALTATVYQSEKNHKNGNYTFKMSYTQNFNEETVYNMKENPEKFELDIV